MNVDTYHRQQECSLSYSVAQCVVGQLREAAKREGFNEKGIKVRITPQKNCKRVGAIIRVIWNGGPEDWARKFPVRSEGGVHIEAHEPHILSFYDT